MMTFAGGLPVTWGKLRAEVIAESAHLKDVEANLACGTSAKIAATLTVSQPVYSLHYTT